MSRQFALSPEIRDAVLCRDGWGCARCRAPGFLEIHHIKPRRKGGTDEVNNLVTLCEYCHALLDGSRRTYLPGYKRRQVREDRQARLKKGKAIRARQRT